MPKWIFSLLLMVASQASAQKLAMPDADAPPPVKRQSAWQPLPAPPQSIPVALKDAEVLPHVEVEGVKVSIDAPFQRYLWFRESDPVKLKADMQAMLLTLNATSQLGCDPYGAFCTFRPTQVGERMLRVDLRHLSDSIDGIKDNLRVWEEYRYDPAYSTLITKDTLKSLTFPDGAEPKVKRKVKKLVKTNERLVDKDKVFVKGGQQFRGRWVWDTEWKEEVVEVGLKELTDVDVVRFNGEHLDLEFLQKLQAILQTEAPIIDADYFTLRATASIQGSGAYKTVFGGLYRDHLGLRDLKRDKGQTEEDVLLRKLGIINPQNDKTAVQIFDGLRSDRRAAVFRRKLNARPSRIDWFPTLAASPEDVPVLFVTNDIGSRDIDIGQHPLFNLVNAKFKAREWIWRSANGLDRYALSSAVDGSLQDLAPQDVANDTTVPADQPPELQAGISCMACHGPQDGYHPFKNDVQVMFRSRAVIFGDVNDGKVPDLFGALQRQEQQYRGDGSDLLRMARTANAKAVLKITGPWAESKDQADVVKLAYRQVVAMARRHAYDAIDAHAALRELGFEVAREEAVTFIRKLLPPVTAGVQVGDLVPEDVRVWALLSGIEITRSDWALLYAFVAVRSQRTLETWAKAKNQGDQK